MYISRIYLKNIRCFKELTIELDNGGLPILWTVFLGDNAAGKTTLLRSIAIGLCDESSAAGLLRESDQGFIRRNCKEGLIKISLRDPKNLSKCYTISTKIEAYKISAGRSFERLRQKTNPVNNFPWSKIFVCGYGAGRGTSGAGDISDYFAISAVYNMFNYTEGLQNPELTIRRIGENKEIINDFKCVLNNIMRTDVINITISGITIKGPWGTEIPLRDIADGYKSTFLWVTDFLGWAISYNKRLKRFKNAKGIVIIDELDQHLHPKWQQVIVDRLKKEFPKIQFITTTHSPLIASSIGNIDKLKREDKLMYLSLSDANVVDAKPIDPLKGRTVDQIIASEAFDYLIRVDKGVDSVLREASVLAGKGDRRKPSEEKRYIEVKKMLIDLMYPDGKSLIEVEVHQGFYNEINKNIEKLEKKLFGKMND